MQRVGQPTLSVKLTIKDHDHYIMEHFTLQLFLKKTYFSYLIIYTGDRQLRKYSNITAIFELICLMRI